MLSSSVPFDGDQNQKTSGKELIGEHAKLQKKKKKILFQSLGAFFLLFFLALSMWASLLCSVHSGKVSRGRVCGCGYQCWWQVTWQEKDDRWQVAVVRWRVTGDVWHVTSDIWKVSWLAGWLVIQKNMFIIGYFSYLISCHEDQSSPINCLIYEITELLKIQMI